MFVVGLAVIVAVVFWMGSMALGSNGEPFTLGQSNAAAKPPGTPSKPAAAKTLWAVVNADGTLVRGSGVISSKKNLPNDIGEYDVTFKRDVSRCAYVASLADELRPGEISAAPIQGKPNLVYVATSNSSGGVADRPFHLAVFC